MPAHNPLISLFIGGSPHQGKEIQEDATYQTLLATAQFPVVPSWS